MRPARSVPPRVVLRCTQACSSGLRHSASTYSQPSSTFALQQIRPGMKIGGPTFPGWPATFRSPQPSAFLSVVSGRGAGSAGLVRISAVSSSVGSWHRFALEPGSDGPRSLPPPELEPSLGVLGQGSSPGRVDPGLVGAQPIPAVEDTVPSDSERLDPALGAVANPVSDRVLPEVVPEPPTALPTAVESTVGLEGVVEPAVFGDAGRGAVSPDSVEALEALDDRSFFLRLVDTLFRPHLETVVPVWPPDHSLYNPLQWVEHLMDFMHQSGGLPWWVTIAVLTAALRVVLLPVTARLQRQARLSLALAPLFQEIRKLYQRTSMVNPNLARTQVMTEVSRVQKIYGVQPIKSLGLSFVQIPLFLGMFFAARELTVYNAAELGTGGMLWFPDLSIPDPYGVLPLISALLTALNIRIGVDATLVRSRGQLILSRVFACVSLVILPLFFYAPSALFLYWLPNVSLSLLLSLLPLSARYCRLANLDLPRELMGPVAASPRPASASVQLASGHRSTTSTPSASSTATLPVASMGHPILRGWVPLGPPRVDPAAASLARVWHDRVRRFREALPASLPFAIVLEPSPRR